MQLMLQNPANNSHTLLSLFRGFGWFGLFFLAILDSSPVPTLAGPDILLAILVSARGDSWLYYAGAAIAGSIIGAYLTFRLARKAGEAWLNSKFGETRVTAFFKLFQRHGTGTLIASTAIPFPFPTSLVFATAGASNYPGGKFLVVVTLSRCIRYIVVAQIASRYGRGFVRILRHPAESWGWLLLLGLLSAGLIGTGILFNRRLAAAPVLE